MPSPERHAADILQRTKWDYSAERADEGILCQQWLLQTAADTGRKIPLQLASERLRDGGEVVKKRKIFLPLWFDFSGSARNIGRFSRRNSNVKW